MFWCNVLVNGVMYYFRRVLVWNSITILHAVPCQSKGGGGRWGSGYAQKSALVAGLTLVNDTNGAQTEHLAINPCHN